MHKRAREHKNLVKYEKAVKFGKHHPLHIMRIPLPRGLKRTGMLDKIEPEYIMEKQNGDIYLRYLLPLHRTLKRDL